MWFEKLLSGVLRVMTPLGPRYLQPTFLQRLYLMWVFRNFPALPVKVLTSRQRRLMESMCAEGNYVSSGEHSNSGLRFRKRHLRDAPADRSRTRCHPSLPKPKGNSRSSESFGGRRALVR